MPKTPPKGVRQSSEDRDLRSIKDRRAASQSDAVPRFDDDDVTSPVELVERGESRYEQELRAIQDRMDSDPAYRALYNLFRRQRKESNRTIGVVASATSEVHQDLLAIREVTDKLQHISDWKKEVDLILRIMKWIVGVVFVAAVGSIIVIATKIYTWGVSSGELEIRLQHLERAVERRSFNFPSAITPSATSTTRNP